MNAPATVDAAMLRRLRWRARRGLLENDIIITRFLDRHAAALGADDWQALQALLELDDNPLLEMLLGHAEPPEALRSEAHRRVLKLLREA